MFSLVIKLTVFGVTWGLIMHVVATTVAAKVAEWNQLLTLAGG